MPEVFQVKVIETPYAVEAWDYGVGERGGVMVGWSPLRRASHGGRRSYEELDDIERHDSDVRRKKYYEDRKHFIRRLVECNYVPRKTKFMTLTYADARFSDTDACGPSLKYFMKKLRDRMGKQVKYIAVPEVQEGRRERYGDVVVHWHLIVFNMGYLPWRELMELWGHGRVDIRDLTDVRQVGRYVAKYVGKALAENGQRHKKAYWCSKGLSRPAESYLRFRDYDDFQSWLEASGLDRPDWGGGYRTVYGEPVVYLERKRCGDRTGCTPRKNVRPTAYCET